MALTNNQKMFCQEYIKLGMNGVQAYMKVYKSCKKEDTAAAAASRMLRNVNIQEYIKELQSKVEEKAVVKIEDIVNELYAIAFADRTKISKNVKTEYTDEESGITYYDNEVELADTDKLDSKEKKVIAGYKKTKHGISVETYDKVKALELLGKYLGMFTERVEINNPEATKILSSINSQLSNRK